MLGKGREKCCLHYPVYCLLKREPDFCIWVHLLSGSVRLRSWSSVDPEKKNIQKGSETHSYIYSASNIQRWNVCLGVTNWKKKERKYTQPCAYLPTLPACTYQLPKNLPTLPLYPALPKHTISQSLGENVNKWRKWTTNPDGGQLAMWPPHSNSCSPCFP